ncbi:CDP-glycerol glycerophosphotransferase family protein [Streptomyces sp. 135]|uniref:CDP-glycerol glycerophosphotransferase family protein n=1 Tax=Streptomyces sp. 135 TaxID=2838850 RepID=UPI001CC110A4|nr:CDP-glycerol glycerophosphotransferase family protein [Streptomyces sp. 135]
MTQEVSAAPPVQKTGAGGAGGAHRGLRAIRAALLTRARRLSRADLVAVGLLLSSFPLLVLSALVPSAPVFCAVMLVGYGADGELHRRRSPVLAWLRQLRFGVSLRAAARQLLTVLLLARAGWGGTGLCAAGIVTFLLTTAAQVPLAMLARRVRLRRKLPLAVRNIPLAVRIPDAPPAYVRGRAAEKSLVVEALGVLGLVAAAAGAEGAGWTGLGLSLAATAAWGGLLVSCSGGRYRVPSTPEALGATDDWLRSYAPGVVLYFSGSKESAYQINMWLRTLEALDERPLVLLRERAVLNRLAPTILPVLCVPAATHVMNLDFSTVRVALYAANTGKNIHFLRVPTARHVFIGHGDSDKVASVNPYTKVYDEVWVAGRAGRERYRRADVGVRDSAIHEVGRPQLATLDRTSATGRDMPSVLYAPTWEGWDDHPQNTSLIVSGEAIVRKLLTSPVPVRVLYRPHPFTGTRAPEARAAHTRIVAMIEEAAAARAKDRGATGDHMARLGRASAVRALDRQVAAAKAPRTGDDAEQSRNAADLHRSVERLRRLEAARSAAYWQCEEPWQHRVILEDGPALYECFDQADALVADISSVVSDFLATEKPYAVTDCAESGAEEFRVRYPTTGAATILSPRADGLTEFLTRLAEDPGVGAEHRSLSHYLLGDCADAPRRFAAAVARAAAAAEKRDVLHGAQDRAQT